MQKWPPLFPRTSKYPNTLQTPREIKKSSKLEHVCYDIRGPVLRAANEMEEAGHKIIKLNIGNPAPFGFEAPQEIINDVALNLPNAVGYTDSKGIFPARKAICQYYQQKGILDMHVNDVYISNGVSELIVMAMQGLLDDGDEMLVPMPDYPLWTAAVNLSGGTAIHYKCDEENFGIPTLQIWRVKSHHVPAVSWLSIQTTQQVQFIHAMYLSKSSHWLKKHDLILFADEIYDKIVYDGIEHVSVAALAGDQLCISFNGLSKAYRIAGYRSGWMAITGDKSRAVDYIEGLDMLASMRLCANHQAQYAIQTALGGYQSINDLIRPGGRLYKRAD